MAMAGRALGVLLAVAVLLAAAPARAADDHWKCFRSCAKGCHHHNNNRSATVADFFPSDSGDAEKAVTAECKNGCQEDACFKDLPDISHTQCTIVNCLSHPHHSKKTECLKDCCDKCFRNKPGPPTPGPGPKPPKPGPGPKPPKPGPSPKPPEPGPPTPGPGPTPPEPSPPTPGPGPTPPEPGPPTPEPGPTPPSPPN